MEFEKLEISNPADVPAERFDRDVDWPAGRPILPAEADDGHPDLIPDDTPGPYRVVDRWGDERSEWYDDEADG